MDRRGSPLFLKKADRNVLSDKGCAVMLLISVVRNAKCREQVVYYLEASPASEAQHAPE
jgi:hypothetical protein